MTTNDQMIRVLIVDDDPGQCRLAEMILEAAGMCVVGTAADGVDAVPCAEKLRPDVVLIDYQMPLLNGIAATRLLRAAGFGPVILTTGGDHIGITPAALEAGAALVLAKDTLVNDLETAIRQAVRSPRHGSTP
jgi:CheY-like chemotaxis protein